LTALIPLSDQQRFPVSGCWFLPSENSRPGLRPSHR